LLPARDAVVTVPISPGQVRSAGAPSCSRGDQIFPTYATRPGHRGHRQRLRPARPRPPGGLGRAQGAASSPSAAATPRSPA